MECAEEAAEAVRALPVFWSNFGEQNCWLGGNGLAGGFLCFWEVWKRDECAVVDDFEGRARQRQLEPGEKY
jgi:hypothetical protein